MKQIVINTNNPLIELDARILKVKAGFCDLGFKTFPTSIIEESCEYKTALASQKWLTSMKRAWSLRNRDKNSIEDLEGILEKQKAVNKLEDILEKVKHE